MAAENAAALAVEARARCAAASGGAACGCERAAR